MFLNQILKDEKARTNTKYLCFLKSIPNWGILSSDIKFDYSISILKSLNIIKMIIPDLKKIPEFHLDHRSSF